MKLRYFILLLLAGCGGAPTAWEPTLPAAGFQGDSRRGEPLYRRHCSKCHGSDLTRGGPKGPPLVHPTYSAGHHADIMFYAAVQRGVHPHHWRYGPMPAISGVSPEETGHILAFVRERQRQAGIEQPEQ